MGFAGVVVMSLLSTSCFYVWQEPVRYGSAGSGAQQQAPVPGTLDELKAQREQEELEKAKPPVTSSKPAEKPKTQSAPAPAPAAPRQEATSVPVARKVPGREGFVFSPYNNKMIDVKGFPKGTKVRDPQYDASENKFFRVP
ncbi:hypothetical protein [Haloferula chungangensis]